MIQCAFCGFENEDGTLFCEKCKSDLSLPAPDIQLLPVNEAPPNPPDFAFMPVAAAPPVETSSPVEGLAIPEVPVFETVLPPSEPIPAQLPRETIDTTPPRVNVPPPLTAPILPKNPPVPSAAAAPVSNIPELKPRLIVIRGEKLDVVYPIYPGENFIGRTDEKPVDIDLENQEPPDRIWSSRQHAVIHFVDGQITIEDLNSLNGTFVNRTRVHPGQKRPLQANDIVQIGTVQMRVVL